MNPSSAGITVEVNLNGVPVPATLDAAALAAIANAVAQRQPPPEPTSKYVTIPQAAQLMCCKRQRVDDLLSSHRLTRFRDGRRVLLLRSEIEEYLRQR